MDNTPQTKITTHAKRNIWIIFLCFIVIIVIIATSFWYNQETAVGIKPTGEQKIRIISAVVIKNDIPIKLKANGTVVPQQTVEVRPQISAIVRTVHIKEGQFVRKGDKLFTLDARTESANLNKAEAQLSRSNADFSNAVRSLNRQKKLFEQKFISRAALDIAQNQVDSLKGQLDFDKASVKANQVTHGFTIITAPISGRTGLIPVHTGSLVQPNIAVPGSVTQPRSAVLVGITQINPINVKFTLPENKLVILQQALAKGDITVSARLDTAGEPLIEGRLVFIDNTVDVQSGSILVKAEFPNQDKKLWPGMFVTVILTPETLIDAFTVPVQAVQTGPENKFLYVVDEDNKVESQAITVRLVQDGLAIVEGAILGTRVVVEGAQNLRPGSTVIETKSSENKTDSANKIINSSKDNYSTDKTAG
ncbi:MAG: efflux RND transporter periplasmic adaptor subunit [Nitrosomonadaceae bacterium]|nr:efflux RND transporter periplasmic adaptor subunit [Nitrosomonadaceae bacterium]